MNYFNDLVEKERQALADKLKNKTEAIQKAYDRFKGFSDVKIGGLPIMISLGNDLAFYINKSWNHVKKGWFSKSSEQTYKIFIATVNYENGKYLVKDHQTGKTTDFEELRKVEQKIAEIIAGFKAYWVY